MTSEKLSEKFDFTGFKTTVDEKIQAYKQTKYYLAEDYNELLEEDFSGMIQKIFGELIDLCANAIDESGSDIAVFNIIVGLIHEEDENGELLFNKAQQVRFLRDVYKADENVVDITRKSAKKIVEEAETEKVANA